MTDPSYDRDSRGPDGESQLSRPASMAFGLGVAGFGALIIVLSLSRGAPWIAVCAGLTFVALGMLVVVDFGMKRERRAIGDALLILIVGLVAVAMAWAALGTGPREFVSTFSLPFVTRISNVQTIADRVMFGTLSLLFATAAVVAAIRLVRRR